MQWPGRSSAERPATDADRGVKAPGARARSALGSRRVRPRADAKRVQTPTRARGSVAGTFAETQPSANGSPMYVARRRGGSARLESGVSDEVEQPHSGQYLSRSAHSSSSVAHSIVRCVELPRATKNGVRTRTRLCESRRPPSFRTPATPARFAAAAALAQSGELGREFRWIC